MKTAIKIVIAVVVVGGLLLAYRLYFVKQPLPNLGFEGIGLGGGAQNGALNPGTGKEFLVALINLEHINLDAGAAVFSDKSFARLRDMSVSLPDEPRGRVNPFKPIGEDDVGVPFNASAGSSGGAASGGATILPNAPGQ